ncbi:MAG: phosphoribosylanthranilate isomerase [Bryobacteraceae bacterium]|nr:phosphoribosylanthranilate isomerase [Bryobacteraceae bacterium]
MTRRPDFIVKICGITNREDAVAAAEAGANALGFNFYPQSPRYLPEPETAAALAEDLDVLRVGIFVNSPPEEVADIVERAALDIVQLHGHEDPADFATLRVWKAFRVHPGWDPEILCSSGAEAYLLDGPAPGTGATFDWTLARNLPQRIILAGGLSPENVGEAVKLIRPWGVDACSRLERAPGIKDHERIRQFVANAVVAAAL